MVKSSRDVRLQNHNLLDVRILRTVREPLSSDRSVACHLQQNDRVWVDFTHELRIVRVCPYGSRSKQELTELHHLTRSPIFQAWHVTVLSAYVACA
jgi:hypothetical protein